MSSTSSASRRSSKLKTGLIIGAVTIACGIGVGVAMENRGDSRPFDVDGGPPQHVVGHESRVFNSLASMTQASDLVVVGRVESVERGRTVGETPDDSITFREIHLEVIDVVRGADRMRSPSEVVIEEEGWDGDGTGYTVNGIDWSRAGDVGVYFLTLKSEPQLSEDVYRLVSSYGRVLEKGETLEASGEAATEEGPWVETDVSQLTRDDLVEKIRAIGHTR